MRRRLLTSALLLTAAPLLAQDEIGAPCASPDLPEQARSTCYTAAQALASGQPQVGIVLAGGNPTLGTASTGGVRLGVIPRVSAQVRLNVAFIRVPDVLARASGSDRARELNGQLGVPAPALGANASVGVFPGVSIAPMLGGVGAVDLLASASWLPLSAAKVKGFEDTPGLAWGGGVRVGLLRESFVTPGVSVSMMYRKLGRVSFGDVCKDEQPSIPEGPPNCGGGSTVGELRFDVADWSTRAAVSKRLLGIGLTAGLGYDRFRGDVAYGFRYPDPVTGVDRIFRSGDLRLSSGRTSAFVNGSFTLLVATIAAEAGVMRGGDPIRGFPSASSDFDPQRRTFFGSVGFRVGL